MGHAAPDVELAEAQLALGRPELIANGEPQREPDEDSDFEIEPDDDGQEGDGGGLIPTGRGFGGRGGGEVGGRGAGEVGEPRALPGNRLIGFLKGSWRELQRVQWPDRRQVIQATGVVIGFVIVAGVFLGVADFLAGKLMNFVLK